MRRATVGQGWNELDVLDDHERHPLHARLRQLEAAGPAIVAATAEPSPVSGPAAAAPAPRPERSRMRRAGSALAYGILGFILGAIFWHFVGFWDFVGQVMFRGHPSDAQISQAPPVKFRERAPVGAPLAVVLEPAACTTLQLDRDSGVTAAVPCTTGTLPLRSLRLARREDLWVTAGQRILEATARGWSSSLTVEPVARHDEQAAAD